MGTASSSCTATTTTGAATEASTSVRPDGSDQRPFAWNSFPRVYSPSGHRVALHGRDTTCSRTSNAPTSSLSPRSGTPATHGFERHPQLRWGPDSLHRACGDRAELAADTRRLGPARPTFSCDIAYSESPAASRASARSWNTRRQVICPFSSVNTCVLLAITSIPWRPRMWAVCEYTTSEPVSAQS